MTFIKKISFLFFLPLLLLQCNKEKMSNSLIPRDVIFKNPTRSNPQLSPDGQWLSYVAPLNGVKNIFIEPLYGGKSMALTNDTKRGVEHYRWSFDNTHILFVKDHEGDENWNLYTANIKTKKITQISDEKKAQTRILGTSQKHPTKIIVGINKRNPQFHDLYLLDIETKEKKNIYENNTYLGFLFDEDLVPQVALSEISTGENLVSRRRPDGTYAPYIKIPFEESGIYGPLALSSDGQTLYWNGPSPEGDLSHLWQINLRNNERTVISASKEADLSEVLLSPQANTPIAASFTKGRQHWDIIDKQYAPDFKTLRAHLKNDDFYILSQTLKNDKWLILSRSDIKSDSFYIFERSTQSLKHLFSSKPHLDAYALNPMHVVEIPSRDGLNLVSYVTLPHQQQLSPATAKKRLPLVVLVHGGPWQRDHWGLTRFTGDVHQWLSNRGYAVLSINYRGSTGFGKKHFSSSFGEWGRKMHEDILDGVQWMVDHEIVDPKRVGIMGGSYGGYETLVGMTFSPDVFACGIDLVGPSNLLSFMGSIPPYWEPLYNSTVRRLGADPRTEKGKAYLKERSPLFYIERIQAPLLIGQGKNDPRVVESESQQIVDALKAKHIDVTYLLYPDEGHGFARPENSISFWAVTEGILHKTLHGKCEPLNDAMKKASAQLKAGKLPN